MCLPLYVLVLLLGNWPYLDPLHTNPILGSKNLGTNNEKFEHFFWLVVWLQAINKYIICLGTNEFMYKAIKAQASTLDMFSFIYIYIYICLVLIFVSFLKLNLKSQIITDKYRHKILVTFVFIMTIPHIITVVMTLE